MRTEKIRILKISGEENLLTLVKKLRSNNFTIFYYNETKPIWVDQDKLVEFSTKFPLLTKIKEILQNFWISFDILTQNKLNLFKFNERGRIWQGKTEKGLN